MEMSLLATSRMWQASYGAVPVQGSFLATQIQLLPWEECGAGVIVHEVRPRSIPKANGTLLPKLSTTWRVSWDRFLEEILVASRHQKHLQKQIFSKNPQ